MLNKADKLDAAEAHARFNDLVRHGLCEVFQAVLSESRDEELPQLRAASLVMQRRCTGHLALLAIGFDNGRLYRRVVDIPWEVVRGQGPTPERADLNLKAAQQYAQLIEDRHVERQLKSLRERLLDAQKAGLPREVIEPLAYEYALRSHHAREFHRMERACRVEADAFRYGELERAYRTRRGISPETAAERRLRQMRDAREHYTRALLDTWGPPGLGVDAASTQMQDNGLALLNANLNKAQRIEYDVHKYFDVNGGASGKTYRIKHGRSMNVYELDDKGETVRGLCFLPMGGLLPGYVMLAQKNALELDEEGAIKIANKFRVADRLGRCRAR